METTYASYANYVGYRGQAGHTCHAGHFIPDNIRYACHVCGELYFS